MIRTISTIAMIFLASVAQASGPFDGPEDSRTAITVYEYDPTPWTGAYGGLSFGRTTTERAITDHSIETLTTSNEVPYTVIEMSSSTSSDREVLVNEYPVYTYACNIGTTNHNHKNQKCLIPDLHWDLDQVQGLRRAEGDEPWYDPLANIRPGAVKTNDGLISRYAYDNGDKALWMNQNPSFVYDTTIYGEPKGSNDTQRATHSLIATTMVQEFETIKGVTTFESNDVTYYETVVTEEQIDRYETNTFSTDEMALGAFAGYRYQWRDFVIGFEGNLTRGVDSGDTVKTGEIQIGYAAGNLLIYTGFGAGTYDSVDFDSSDITIATIGADFLINENLFVGAKVTPFEFEDDDNDLTSTPEGNNVAMRVGWTF